MRAPCQPWRQQQECPVRQEQWRREIWHFLPLQEAQDRFLQTKFDAFRLQRTLTNLTGVVRQGGKEASPGHETRTKWTAAGLCSSIPRPMSTMSVEAELIRTQTVTPCHHHQCRSRGCCAPRLCLYASSSPQREVARWPNQGTSVGHRRPTRAACKQKQESGIEWRRLQRHHVRARTAQFRHRLFIHWRNPCDHDQLCRVVLSHERWRRVLKELAPHMIRLALFF